jgi:hypothetical protein
VASLADKGVFEGIVRINAFSQGAEAGVIVINCVDFAGMSGQHDDMASVTFIACDIYSAEPAVKPVMKKKKPTRIMMQLYFLWQN